MPRRAGLGCRPSPPARRSSQRASMRPRRARLGCASHTAPLTPGRDTASMRPRRARLGWLAFSGFVLREFSALQ